LARTSTRSLIEVVEQYWTLVGTRRGQIWYARRIHHHSGAPVSVRFDGLSVLHREEKRHDVVGFFHTHPGGLPRPSTRDVRTMRAWCSSFGKPLLSVIQSPEGVAGFRFDDDVSDGIPLAILEVFSRNVIIGVESDGRKVSS
jgi:proteasome lid subunit RPN8/RPN11